MPDLNQIPILNLGVYIFAALVTLVLLVGTTLDRTPKHLYMKLFIAMLADNIITLLGEIGMLLFQGDIRNIVVLKLSGLLAFGGGTVLIALYTFCLLAFVNDMTPRVSMKWGLINAIMGAVYFILVVVSLFNGMLFDFDENGFYKDGPLYWLVHVLDYSGLFIGIIIIICHHNVLSLKSRLYLLSFSILPLLSIPLMLVWDAAPLYLATTLALIIVFILFHGELIQRLAKAEVEIAEKERRLTEQRISTMISQIRPHFIYNTLGSIYQLCLDKPEDAAELTRNFSKYLRGNFSELNNNKPIPLSKEIEHVKYYVSIEQVRFPDITIVFDIRSMDFLLPALSVQPLVENAIKHGLMGLESGGSVIISAYDNETSHIVCVKDNGIGFDPDKVLDGKTHIGIHNIRERLSAICSGTLTIESAVEKGTTATISIPKEDF